MSCCICFEEGNIKFACCGTPDSSCSYCKNCIDVLVFQKNPSFDIESTDISDKLNPASVMNPAMIRCPSCNKTCSSKKNFKTTQPTPIFFEEDSKASTCILGKPLVTYPTTLGELNPASLTLNGTAQFQYIKDMVTFNFTGIMFLIDGIYVSPGIMIFDWISRKWKSVNEMSNSQRVEVENFRVISFTLSNSSEKTCILNGEYENIFSLSSQE